MTPTEDLPPLPTFLIIGAQKSATRWLRDNLGAHPSIWTAEDELSFFDSPRRYALGADFYRSQFEGWSGQPFLGESTPGYLMPRNEPVEVARRMADVVPDARLMAVLRDPVDRAQSALVHHIRYGRLRPSTDLMEYVRDHEPDGDRLGLVAGGRYADSLEPFVSRFEDQLLVFLHDDVRDDPARVYADALRHVGADASFVPSGLDVVRFSNRSTDAGEPAPGSQPLSDDQRRELFTWFRDDVRRLEDLLGRDLSVWEPAA